MNKFLFLIWSYCGLGLLAQETPAAEIFTKARWIAPPVATNSAALPFFRKEFALKARPERATFRVIGLGDYDAHINGRRLAATGINQPWSQYEETLYYHDFDITALLERGTNCVGVMLGNSFWHNPNPPEGRYNKVGPQHTAAEPLLLCAEITLQQSDGTVERISTDDTWRTVEGPVTFSHVYAGEDFDARRQQPGWDRPGYDDRNWLASRLARAPAARLLPQNWPGIMEFDHYSPVSIKSPAPGVFLYSFPQNLSAQLRVELTGGKPGDRVAFRCGEHKNPQDRLFGGYVVGCETITDGQPLEHQWIHFYLGMQFVEVAGAVPEGQPNPDNRPVLKRPELVHVRAGLPQAGQFQSSSELYNRTHQLIDWAMRANSSWVMTDCPHREKLGWLECSYLLAPTFMYRYDCRDWFGKIARDIRDAQEPSGRVLTVAPNYRGDRFPGPFNFTVEWGAAAVMLPWQHYEWYGDAQILRDSFDSMRRFTDFLDKESQDGLAPGGLGDWYDYEPGQPPGPSRYTPTELSATATWALCALTVSRAAEVLGKDAEAQRYRQMHARIAASFQRHFQDSTTRKLRHKDSPQCADAMALCADVVPQTDRPLLIEDIIADLKKRGWQQTPGDVGHAYFIRALAEAGRSDVLHRVYSRVGVGSYSGILAKGLTSLPESWDGVMDGSQSLNHCMLGHVMEWFYGYVAGVRQQPGSTGWKSILIAPEPGPLTSAEAVLQSPRGRVVSHWEKKGTTLRVEIEIPPGVSASARLPSGRILPLKNGVQTIEDPLPPEPK